MRRIGLGALFLALATIGDSATGSTAARGANGEPEWLVIANLYRASAGLAPVTENPEASAGAAAHSRYLALHRLIGHDEERSKAGYSPAGLHAGMTGNVFGGYGGLTQRQTIKGWMAAPFHGLAMLDPHAKVYEYGAFTNNGYWAATLSLFGRATRILRRRWTMRTWSSVWKRPTTWSSRESRRFSRQDGARGVSGR